jgi:hypothetical protein
MAVAVTNLKRILAVCRGTARFSSSTPCSCYINSACCAAALNHIACIIWFLMQPRLTLGGATVSLPAGWIPVPTATLQRENTEISKQIFPEKKYRGLSPYFHIHASVWEIYILPWLVCLIRWRKYVDQSRVYINRSKTHECGNWGWGRALPRKGRYCINEIAVAVRGGDLLYTSAKNIFFLKCTGT